MQTKKAIELGHIFQLGTKYPESMKDATFIDKSSNERPYYMGCYGIGVSRALATIYEKSIVKDRNGKPTGIALPTNIAPYVLQIISKGDDVIKTSEAQALYEVLSSHNVKTILDDRTDKKMGIKIKDAKVLGTPYLGLLGEKSKIFKNNNAISDDNIVKILTQNLQFSKKNLKFKDISNRLFEKYIDFDDKKVLRIIRKILIIYSRYHKKLLIRFLQKILIILNIIKS